MPSSTVTFARTLEDNFEKHKDKLSPGKRGLMLDRVEKFKKVIEESKETSLHHGRQLMSQARLRHDKELKELVASLE